MVHTATALIPMRHCIQMWGKKKKKNQQTFISPPIINTSTLKKISGPSYSSMEKVKWSLPLKEISDYLHFALACVADKVSICL